MAGSDAEAAKGSEGERLRDVFAERRISLRSMDASLRLATAGAAASLLGAAVLVALRDVAGSPVGLPATAGVRTTLAGPLFTATLVLLALGCGYVMTGAVLAHRWVAVGAAVVMTGAIGAETGVLGAGVSVMLPAWARLTTRLLLVAIWVVAIGVLAWRRGRHGDAAEDRTARIVLLILYCGLFGGYLLVLRAASPSVNGLTLFPVSVSVLMIGVSVVSVPILQVAATDFGEWGQLAGERVLAAAGAHRHLARLAVPAMGCLALVAVAWATETGGAGRRAAHLAEGTLITAVLIGVVLAAGKVARLGGQKWPQTLNFAGVFAVVAVGVWVLAPAVSLAAGQFKVTPTPEVSASGYFTAAAAVHVVTLPGKATMLVPAGWASRQAGGIAAYLDTDPALGAMTLEAAWGAFGNVTLTQLAAHGFGAPAGPARSDGSAQRLQLRPKQPANVAVLWLERAPGSQDSLVLFGRARSARPVAASRELEAIVHSVRLPGSPPAHIPAHAVETPAAAAQAGSDRLEVWSGTVRIILSVLMLLLVGGVGRRWPGRVRATMLLFGMASLLPVFYFADSFGRVLAGPAAAWPYLGETGLLAGLGVLGLASLALARGRTARWAERLPRALTGLVGGVLLLRGTEALYGHALSASRVAVWAAVIVLAAIAWDITMSGESMTNHATPYLPRSTRVLAFFGYAILLAATVVFFSGQRVAGSGQAVSEVFFEPEAVTQAALFRLALPLLLMLFFLGTFGEKEEEKREDREIAGESAAPDAPLADGEPRGFPEQAPAPAPAEG